MHSFSPWWRERARPVFVTVPLEAKGKSFNALKPLEVLPLKDSPWNQLGWGVFPYEGAYQSGLPVKGVCECVRVCECVCVRERERERESRRERWRTETGMHMHLDV